MARNIHPMVQQDEIDFLLSMPRFAAEAEAQKTTFDVNVAEYYREKSDIYASMVSALVDSCDGETFTTRPTPPEQDNTALVDDLRFCIQKLLVHILAIRRTFENRVGELSGVSGSSGGRFPSSSNSAIVGTCDSTGRAGRPRKDIKPGHLLPLRELGFKWTSISKILGVSERTLRNRRHEIGFQELNLEFSEISDELLDHQLQEIMSLTSRSGETYMVGALRVRGLRIQRQRLRDSLQRIDPVGRALRRRRVTYRRRYRVPSPNYIWHIDGNHKLIDPWGFVIHGGIDGYSRMCVYLHCSTSNRARVVLDLFKSAVREYGCPQRVRSDYGTENVEVARYMVRQRGLGRGSMITGLSTHNQRIERLWRDVKECITIQFSDIFFYMENQGLADRYNPIHMAAIRYVFGPRINRALLEFRRQWNNHPIRTEGNNSPNMLWVRGSLERNLNDTEQDYEDSDPIPDIETNNNVQVPDVGIQLTDAKMRMLNTNVEPLKDDNNQGVNLFIETVELLTE